MLIQTQDMQLQSPVYACYVGVKRIQTTRKGVSELLGPALVCLSDLDKKMA